MLKIKLLLCFFIYGLYTQAQTFSGYGGFITDNGSKNFFPLTVSGISSNINQSFGVMGVTVNIKHNYVSDLNIFLIAPDNTVIELSSRNGGNGKNYDKCTFSNNSSNKITTAKAPFNGFYKPEGSIGVVNNDQNPNGTWKLMVMDSKLNKDSGWVINWQIIFSNSPSKLEPFISSNLPIILINTHGQSIKDEPRITSNFRIINKTGGVNKISDSSSFFNYLITIEYRGSTSQMFPKKPMGFTTVNKSLADTNVSLLGMPSEHDWVLNATYNDKTLMRDVLTYEMARRTGRYATRHRYCELFINGNYEGIYVLMEKVKRDKNRVDIAKLEPKDTTGNDLTGGYILKIDKTTGNNNGGFSLNGVYYQYDYPNGDDMQVKQKNYIQSYLSTFETILAGSNFTNPTTGWRKYADINSFIDYSIMNEISKNVDGYRLSTYLFKDKDSKGGKIKMGPIWDFNLAWNNADYNNSSDPVGWEIDVSSGLPFWWKRFRADTGYGNSYYCRWAQLRQSTLSLYNLYKFIDSTYNYLEEASYRNFQRWPVMGIYIWPNPSPLSYSMKEEADSMKSWIKKRCNWMDKELSKNCKNITACRPTVKIYSDKTSICKYQKTILFADGIGSSFKWSPSTGLSVTTGREVIASPTSTTTYKVLMKTDAGCADSAFITIKVLPLPSKNITGNTSICIGQSTKISVQSGYKTYLWTPSYGLDNTNTNSVIASPTSSQNYKISITDSLGCKDSAYVYVRINPKPDLKLVAEKDTVCNGNFTTIKASGADFYKWFPAYGLNDTSGNTVTVYPQNTKYTVVGTSTQNCKDTNDITVYVFPADSISIKATDLKICLGANTWLTAVGGSNYIWRKTKDFDGANSPMVNVSPKENTVYFLKGLNKYGCEDSASIEILVFPEIKFTVSGIDTICKNDYTTLIASGNYDYNWYPSDGLNKTYGAEVKSSPSNTTIYTITASAGNSCKDSTTFKVYVHELPNITAIALPDTVIEGQSTLIKVKGGKTYKWNPDNWLNFSNDSVISTPPVSVKYVVTGTDSNNCSNFAEVNITVNKKQTSINYLQNSSAKIYPNPVHDFINIENCKNSLIKIFDNDGKLVYIKLSDEKTTVVDIKGFSAGLYLIEIISENKSENFRIFKY
ncbi:MAG: CotH kinase family protein [Bacteroidetes bacterium]|nr:CotH kinase family protein [Bacteroidota bacterium]